MKGRCTSGSKHDTMKDEEARYKMTALEKEHALLRQWRALPSEKQQDVLDFVEFLCQKSAAKRPLRSALGLCADLDVTITPEDISQARKEMWGNFPTWT